MNWQIIVGIIFLIGGFGSITTDIGTFFFGLVVGAVLLAWGLKRKGGLKKSNKTTEQCQKQRNVKQSIPDHYIVFDIETTGFSRNEDRIIEIAANKYSSGELIDQFHSYVNPGIPISAFITQLTGISNQTVKDAPTILDIKKEVLNFFGGSPLVGHNITTFDIPFLNAQLNTNLNNKLYDTLQLAKEAFPGLPSYKLTFLDQALHLGGSEHHRAENDIAVTNSLFQACAEPKKYQHFLNDKDALSEIKIEKKRFGYQSIDIHSIQPKDPNTHPNTSLTGCNIVFSGYFSIPLEDMMQTAVDAGAILKSSVSKKVQYLVVGEQDMRFADENGMTSKSRTAIRLIEQEHIDIKIINEAEFLALAAETK